MTIGLSFWAGFGGIFFVTLFSLFGTGGFLQYSLIGLILFTCNMYDIYRRALVLPSILMSASICFGYFIGSLFSFIRYDFDIIPIFDNYILSSSSIESSCGYILLSASIISISSLVDLPLPTQSLRISTKNLHVFNIISVLCCVTLFADTFFGNATTIILNLIFPFLILSFSHQCILVVESLLKKDVRVNIYNFIAIVIQFCCLLFLGRRIVLFSLLAVLIFSHARVKFKLSSKVIFITILSVLLIFISQYVFFAMRVAAWETKGGNFIERLTVSADILINRPEVLSKELSNNLNFRGFILNFPILLLDLNAGGISHGGIFIDSALSSIPFVESRLKGEETVLNDFLGYIFVEDAANSVITAGFVDFGVIGAVLYPLCIVFILRLFTNFFKSSKAYQFMVPLILYTLLSIEAQLDTWFLLLRYGVFLSVIIFIARICIRPSVGTRCK